VIRVQQTAHHGIRAVSPYHRVSGSLMCLAIDHVSQVPEVVFTPDFPAQRIVMNGNGIGDRDFVRKSKAWRSMFR
jgi:hypothetical protein